MAELSSQARLQPSLLDRLTDTQPDRRSESREQRVLTPSQLRESVRRDLTWLLNAVQLSAVLPLDGYPEVQRSVLNYGMPDLAGRTLSSIDPTALEQTIRRIIWEYEPTLIPASVRVSWIESPDWMGHNALCFQIEADLWSQPFPVRMSLRTDIDLEDGQVQVSELRPGQASGA
jgi:type VI secretion system protein ImpF